MHHQTRQTSQMERRQENEILVPGALEEELPPWPLELPRSPGREGTASEPTGTEIRTPALELVLRSP